MFGTAAGVAADLVPVGEPHRARALVGMSKVFVETFIGSFAVAPEEVVLDFDPTDDPVHGNQE